MRGNGKKQEFHEKHRLLRAGGHNKEEIHTWISIMEGLPLVLLFVPIDVQPYFSVHPKSHFVCGLSFYHSKKLPFSFEILYLPFLLLGIDYI